MEAESEVQHRVEETHTLVAAAARRQTMLPLWRELPDSELFRESEGLA